jgi:hypothetical protein
MWQQMEKLAIEEELDRHFKLKPDEHTSKVAFLSKNC